MSIEIIKLPIFCVNIVQEMSDSTAELVVVKQEPDFQEDAPSLGSAETQQVDADPVGLIVPVKIERVTDDSDDFYRREIEIEICPAEFCNPVMIPAPQYYEPGKEGTLPIDTLSYGDVNNPKNNSAELTITRNNLSRKSQSLLVAQARGKLYNCSYCEYKCSSNYGLVQHMRTHTGEKPYSCSVCPYKCSVKQNLVLHIRTHTGEKPYICNTCQYKCSQKHSLVQHLRTHMGEKPYSCIECPYKCSRKDNFVRHMRTHTVEKPFSCDDCDYKCTKLKHFITHKRKHTGEKPYGCSYCQYKTAEKRKLVQHIRTHTGESPYSCSVCHYKFAIKYNMVRHMRRHVTPNL